MVEPEKNMHVIKQLGISVSEDTLQDMIQLVMKAFTSKENPEVIQTIDSCILIHGFRPGKASRATPAQIRKELIRMWNRIFPLTEMLISVWSKQHEELLAKCEAFVEQNYENDFKITIDDDELTQSRNAKVVEQLSENFIAENPDAADPEKIQLLIACGVLTKAKQVKEEDQSAETIPAQGEEESTSPEQNEDLPDQPEIVNEEQLNNQWEKILGEISSIPFNEQCWATTSQFIERVKLISNSKIQELEKDRSKKSVYEIWKNNQAIISDWASYFEISDVESWTTFKDESLANNDLISTIEDLAAQLKAFDNLLNLPRATTKAEQKDRDTRRATEETSIYDKYQFIINCVSVDSKNQPGESTQQGKEDSTRQLDSEESSAEELPQIADQTGSDEVAQVIPGGEEIALQPGKADAESSAPDEDSAEGSTITVGEHAEKEEPSLVSTSVGASGKSDEKPRQPAILETGEASSMVSPGSEIEVENQDISPTDELILKKIKSGEFSTAYWLAWGLEQQEKKSIIPSKLVAAVQGIFWSLDAWPEKSNKVVDGITEFVHPLNTSPFHENEIVSHLSLLSGIYYSLMDRNGSWLNWLSTGFPASSNLRLLVELVKDYVPTKGIILDPDIVRFVVNAGEVDNYITNLAEQVKDWLSTAKNKSTKYYRANHVWNEIINPASDNLYQLLNIVARDQRDRLGEVETELQNWQHRDWVDKRIIEIDQDITQRRGNDIVGNVRVTLINWVTDICEIVQQWASLVRHQQKNSDGQNWQKEETGKLCIEINNLIDPILDDLKYGDINTSPGRGMVQQVTEKMLLGLKQIINPDDQSIPSGGPSNSVNWDNFSVESSLNNLLMMYPELGLFDDGSPDKLQASSLIEILSDSSGRSIEEAIEKSISLHDYRFINVLLEKLQDSDLWETRVKESLRADVANFTNKELDEALVTIEQALLDGIIGEPDHTTYKSAVESIKKEIHSKGPKDLQSISFTIFTRQLQEIRKKLGEERKNQVKTLKRHWDQLLPTLLTLVNNDQQFFDQIKEVVESSISEGDLRASGEYLSHLDNVGSKGESPDKAIFEKHHSIDAVTISSFREAIPVITNLLEPWSNWNLVKIRDAIRRDEPIPGFSRQSPTSERRRQIAKALDAWRRLKADGPELDVAHLADIKTILEYVGFNLIEPGAISRRNVNNNLQNFQSWRIHANTVGSSPIAQFGSLRDKYYDIIGVWDRPGFEIIGSQVNNVMQQTGNQPAILFYFHYLTQSKRDYLINSVRKSGLPMLVIDEALMLFLAKERDSQIEPMLRCTLPYSVINPYFPAAAGKVPPEVYKGREDFKRRLIEPFGTTIVYGGRQLGKSALLRQVEREYHHPENGQYVIYEDIRNIGDPASGRPYQGEFRDRLSQALLNLRLIEPQQKSMEFDRIINILHQQVLVDGKKLLLLLDEADHFLSADADKNFQVIHKLKNLMDKTNRNFKIVIAGLHNVQRFEKISNQPLAHLGTPLEIGPLEPKNARDLLVDPLHAMGFYFGHDPEHEDNSLILHILSYTNYHPGLIQLFGSYLYDHLILKHQQSTKPPFSITRNDVEAVYRKQEVRKAISDRFNWTLALDPLYEAVTLSIILEQLDDKNGFNRVFTPKQIKQLAAENWPEAFGSNLSPERFGSVLEEMRGLGLLSASADNESYRLRSPNLVSMMGTQDQILERMDTLSRMSPPDENAMTSFHFRENSGEFSPITFGQERALNNPKSGVTLIFGSDALGIRSLDQALTRLVPKDTGMFREIRIASYGFESIRHELNSLLKEKGNSSFIVAYRYLSTSAEKMIEEITGAIQFCSQVKSRITFKVVFGLDSESIWQWFQIPQQTREELEERVDITMSLSLWDRIGVRQWLEMESTSSNEIQATDSLVNEILDCTGGWTDLIEELITKLETNNPEVALEMIRGDLSDKNSSLRNQFLTSLGVNEEIPIRLLNSLQKNELQDLLKDEINYLEVIKLDNERLNTEEIKTGVEYLKKLSIVKTEPLLVLNSAVARAWNGS